MNEIVFSHLTLLSGHRPSTSDPSNGEVAISLHCKFYHFFSLSYQVYQVFICKSSRSFPLSLYTNQDFV